MKDALKVLKLVLSAVGSFFANLYGGWSAVLTLLVILMIVDMFTGFSLAVVNKEVNSKKMKIGIVCKFLTFVIILVGYYIDLVLIDSLGSLPNMWGITISIKLFMSVYFCFEELISVIENSANLGIPVPKWLRNILTQVSSEVNSSTPGEVVSLIKNVLSFLNKNKENSVKSDKDLDE